MENLVEQFLEVRQYLVSHLEQMANVYFTQIWDPLMKFMIIKETNNLIENLLIDVFPEFPIKFLPKVKFRIFDEEHEIEAGVQSFLNTKPDLIFLGTSELECNPFDFYIRKSWDPSVQYMFVARYGHDIDNQYSGAKVAAAEYFQGIMSPLSVAYGMAVEDGFIS